jgi:hypothetical protein
VCEESPNSGAKRWLAGGEWAAVAYLSDGENDEKKEASASVFLFIVGREREEMVPVPHISVGWLTALPVWRECGAVPLPYPGRTRTRRGRFEADPGHCSTRTGPIH